MTETADSYSKVMEKAHAISCMRFFSMF